MFLPSYVKEDSKLLEMQRFLFKCTAWLKLNKLEHYTMGCFPVSAADIHSYIPGSSLWLSTLLHLSTERFDYREAWPYLISTIKRKLYLNLEGGMGKQAVVLLECQQSHDPLCKAFLWATLTAFPFWIITSYSVKCFQTDRWMTNENICFICFKSKL